MAVLRLLGLTFLLLATLGCAVAEPGVKQHHFVDGGRDIISEDYVYFYNYYPKPVHWYFYEKPSFTSGSKCFDYQQSEYFSGGRPGTHLYSVRGSGFEGFKQSTQYYGYYTYGSKKFTFKFTFNINRFNSDKRNKVRPYTFTAYPKSGSYGFHDDSFGTSKPTDGSF